ncbi:MAG: MBL fold metallo-hydrolase [bacterium]|nr:MBL fold metallo-hydrolase [bacterium]
MFQFKIRKFIPILILGMLLSVFPFSIQAQTYTDLEIHYINVQQGQSTLIIGPDGTTVLYDGGNHYKGDDEVIPYLESIGIDATDGLDYIVTSHRHTDHYWGLTEVMVYGYDVAEKVYDNGSNYYNSIWQDFVDEADLTTAGGVTAMALGDVIQLGDGATATCVAVNGSVKGYGAVPNGQDHENDRSLCLLIQYEDFDFLVTGDLGGGDDDGACTGRSTSQNDVESYLAKALMPAGGNPLLSEYGLEIMHVGHHGSESSTNSVYFNLLTPKVACISVGDGQGSNWYHPRIDVVDNVLLGDASCITAPDALVLQTEEGKPTGIKTSYSGYSVGDIKITTDGDQSYTISASGSVSQGSDERTSAGLPVTYDFDEYTATDNAPVIYDVYDDSTTRTSTTIKWSTNEDADSVLKYGTSTGSYTTTESSSTDVVNHSISLTSLTQFTVYYYIVESTDTTGKKSTSPEYTFVTVNASDIKVVFSEVFYDTPGSDPVEEWIELYNNSPVMVDVSGWKITDNNGSGSSFVIPAGSTIESGTFFTIANDSTGFDDLYGYDADVYGDLPALNNSGEAIILYNKTGTEMDAVAMEGGSTGGTPTGWGSTTAPSASTGDTIVRSDETDDNDTYSDWTTDTNNGYPQTQFMNDPDSMLVVFSEVYYDTTGTDSDEEWIELYNNSPMEVDISSWKITDNNGSGSTYTIPASTEIAAYSYFTIAVDSTGFDALYGYDADLYGSFPSLNNSGDALILKNSSGTVKDEVAWEGGASSGTPTGWGSSSAPNATTGKTIVRSSVSTDGDTYADWTTADNDGFPQTQTNSFPVVFSEVYYDTTGTDSDEEWIELYNNSPVVVDIGGWKIKDNNGSGGSYTIPSGNAIDPGTYFTIALDSTGFDALYGYDADLYGSFPSLNNSGDALILEDSHSNVIDTVAWEGGAGAGTPTGWGSSSAPSASTGNTIVRTTVTTDSDTYSDWGTASNDGNPQTQSGSNELVVISEVYYDTTGTDADEEWIELYNNGSATVNIGGWTITDNNGTGSTYTIPAGKTIAAGSYFTIAADSTGFTNLYSYAANVYGNIPSLGNSGDALILKDGSGNEKDAVAWEGGGSGGTPTGWGSTTAPSASTGSSIVRSSVTTDSDTYSDWTTASSDGNPQTN